jgi:hypothetical protein
MWKLLAPGVGLGDFLTPDAFFFEPWRKYNITKAMGQTEPQFLSDPMSDRKKKVFANSEYKLVNVKDTSNISRC